MAEMQDDAGKTPETPRWQWKGGDRFLIGGRMYTGAEAMGLLDRYEQQDRMKTREINLIVPENKALEAKITHLEGQLGFRKDQNAVLREWVKDLEAALREAEAKLAFAGIPESWFEPYQTSDGDMVETKPGNFCGHEPRCMTFWEHAGAAIKAKGDLLQEAEAKVAGYKQSVVYALDRFGAIGSMSDWTDSDLSDATQEARDAAGTLKRNVRLLEQPKAGS